MDKAPPRFKPRRARPRGWLALAVLLAFAIPAARAAAPLRAAVFPFTLETGIAGDIDGPGPADQARLRALDAQLRAALLASGRYVPVDMPDIALRLAGDSLHGCAACAAELARAAGAQVAVDGWVDAPAGQRARLTVVVRDAANGTVLRAGSVVLGGHGAGSWRSGLARLLADRILGGTR